MDNITSVTVWGEYSSLIRTMIARFKANEGGVLRSKLLDKAFVGHKITRSCVENIKNYVSARLRGNQENILSIDDLKEIKKLIILNVKLRKFDSRDFTNGLGITIHDTYSAKIYLDYINVSDGYYDASLSFEIQDHFGLDVGDVNGKLFEYVTWFCSWFVLQKHNEYGYKPFINKSFFAI